MSSLKESIKKFVRLLLPFSLQKMHGAQVFMRRTTFFEDGLATVHNCDFIKTPRFREAYAKGKATGSWLGANVRWRVHVACWVAKQVVDLEGDFIECGVNRGGLSRAIYDYAELAVRQKTFYLLDTFCGLSPKYINEQELKNGIRPGGYSECYEDVLATFKPFQNVKIIRGTVPDTLPEVPASKIAYLSIDMNCVEPEISALRYFWGKIVRGGMVLLDDYGFEGHSCQKTAFDEFASAHDFEILSLPTGQGLIVKK